MPTEVSSQVSSDRAAWLNGPALRCASLPRKQARPWRLVLLGAPGVGKGTQAELLVQSLGVCHLSTGEVFRAAKSAAGRGCATTPAMAQALDFMRRGELVPDATVLSIIRERTACLTCGGGFLLDGFPRTVTQAQALDAMLIELGLALDAVLDFQLSEDEIIERLSGRRTCTGCGAVYHISARPSKRPGICDHCGSRTIQREDDRPEAIGTRLIAYQRSTTPLTDFYRQRNLLIPIDAAGTPDEVFQRTVKALVAVA